jgi:hypothetical protein
MEASFAGVVEEGQLKFRRGGEDVLIAPVDLVSITAEEGAILRTTSSMLFEFANGDRLYAQVEDGNFDELKLVSPATGSISIFVDPLRQIWVKPDSELWLPPQGSSAEMDELFLVSGDGLDRIPGELKRFDRSGVVFSHGSGTERLFRFREDSIFALRLMEPRLPKPKPGVQCRARFRDGSILTGVLAQGRGREPILKLAFGPDATLSLSHVVSFEFLNDAYRALGDLTPTKIQQTPYLEGGLTRGWRKDKGFSDDGSLRIGSKTWRSGISVAARAEMTYELKQPFGTLTAMIGVDPSTAERAVPGSVRIKVMIEGKARYESPLLVAGEEAIPLKVDLSGAKRMTLLVEFGGSGPTGAFAVFADALLTR